MKPIPKSKMSQNKTFINGILLVNKPQGYSSNAVLQRIKRLYGAKKAGHTGSLDPMATGMLPICFGDATKFSQYALDAHKTYRARGCLGIKTSTGDALGDVIDTCHDFNISQTQLEQVIQTFLGDSLQTPSMFSALKHKGKPLYKYAREGIILEREPRPIHIQQLELNHFDGKHFDIEVTCSKGTYIRNLVEDIGECLGVGAHVDILHRIHIAGFEQQPMYTPTELEEQEHALLTQYLLPMDIVVSYLPTLNLLNSEISELRLGRVLNHFSRMEPTELLRLYDECKQFAGLGSLDASGTLKAKRLLSEQTYLNREQTIVA